MQRRESASNKHLLMVEKNLPASLVDSARQKLGMRRLRGKQPFKNSEFSRMLESGIELVASQAAQEQVLPAGEGVEDDECPVCGSVMLYDKFCWSPECTARRETEAACKAPLAALALQDTPSAPPDSSSAFPNASQAPPDSSPAPPDSTAAPTGSSLAPAGPSLSPQGLADADPLGLEAGPADVPELAASTLAMDVRMVPGLHGNRPETWKVRGDGRCLFRAAYREEIDPHNSIERDYTGEPTDVDMIENEVVGADSYREQVCNLMEANAQHVSSLLGIDGDLPNTLTYIENMRQPGTWGCQICLHYLPEVMQRRVCVYGWNQNLGRSYFVGQHLPLSPQDSVSNSAPVLLWYNGSTHYDLIHGGWQGWAIDA